MEARSLRPYCLVLCLMAATSILLAMTVDVDVTNEAGVRLELPRAFGDWTGSEIQFCQEANCRASYLIDEFEDPGRCARCGGPLSAMSFVEADLLPPDTGMLRMVYENPAKQPVHVSIVLSGKERGSIHRPEVCQTGQGRELVGKEVVAVPLRGRAPLKVMVLNLRQTFSGKDGSGGDFGRYYAYWFVGKDRETPYHLMRMYLMATDRITRNVAHRWAYIAIEGPRETDSDAYKQQVQEIIAQLYPYISIRES